jgi:hypothetical protein
MILLEDFILDAIQKSELACETWDWDETVQKQLAEEITAAVVAYLMQGRGPPPESLEGK